MCIADDDCEPGDLDDDAHDADWVVCDSVRFDVRIRIHGGTRIDVYALIDQIEEAIGEFEGVDSVESSTGD